MIGEEAVVAVIDALENVGVPSMLVGSLSTNLYGIPRSTEDADFVVQLGSASLQQIMARLGPGFRLDPQASFETATGTTRHIVEALGDTAFKIELFHLSNDAHDQERFARRRQVRVLNRMTYAPTPEDVVITKLRWSLQANRSKDVDDVRNVIAVQGKHLDWDYIHRWCDQHGTRALLDKIRQSIPET